MSPNLPRCPWILALVLAAAAPAHAYVGPERPRPGGVATPAGAGPWIAVADLAGWSPQWAAAEQLLGEGWQVAFAAASGAPAWIIGPGLPLGRPAGADDGTVALARALVERLAGALNVEDVSSLVLDRAVSSPNVQGHEIVGIQFRWTAHGRDVRGPLGNLRVHLTFNGTLGRLAAIGSELVTGVEAPSDPTFPLATAVAAALDRSGDRAGASVLRAETYVRVRPGSERPEAALVHEVQVRTQDPPHLWAWICDAQSGALLESRDDLRTADVIGTVTAGTWDDSPVMGFALRPARRLRVAVEGGNSAFTDAASGGFAIPHPGTAPVNVAGRFVGEWSTVNNWSGSGNQSFLRSATPGVPAPIVMNPAPVGEHETAEATAYRFTTEAHLFLKARLPSFTGLAAFPTNVNLANTCNAYYDGTSINFFRSGGGCNNTAYEEIVGHEFGHAFHAWFHGSTLPGGFSEGIGDHVGLLLASRGDDGSALPTLRMEGRNFFTNGQIVRDYRPGGPANRTRWPCAGCEVHKAGEVWAGFVLDYRDHLIASLGLPSAAEVCEITTLAPFARNPSDMDAGVLGVFLQDDDDGNLSNGTPHFREIAMAADRHDLPRPPEPRFLTFEHRALPWTLDAVHACEARVLVRASGGTVTGASLEYSVNGGALQSLPMAPTGAPAEYRAAFPALALGSRVRYSFRGRDSAGHDEASASFDFALARPGPTIREEFETGPGGWAPGVAGPTTAGFWEHGDPEGTFNGSSPFQPEEDHTPGPGVNCWTTGRLRGSNVAANDLDGGPVHLTSPTLLLGSAAAATLRFRYWLQIATVLDDALVVRVSNDDGFQWTTALTLSAPAPGWREASVPLDALLPLTDRMRIRLVADDTPSNSLYEAAVDGVELSLADTLPALGSGDPTPPVGQPLAFALSIPGLPGSAWVLGVSLATARTWIAPFGTFALGLPIVPLAIGTLDGSGNGGFTIPIPAEPALVGVAVHAQAFVQGTPELITNLASIMFRAP